MAQVWIARNPGNWSVVSVTVKRPTRTRNDMWSMHGIGVEVSTTAFEAIFGWLPRPGSLHRGAIELRIEETEED